MQRSPLLLIIVTASFFLHSPLRAAQADFTITISSDHPTARAGSDLWIKIRMTNVSNHDVDCTDVYSSGVDRSYQYDIKDNSRTPVKKRIPHPNHPEIGEPGSIYACTLGPGQSTKPADSRITWAYDLSQPGDYTVQVWRKDPGSGGIVRSNSMTIIVSP